MTVGKIEEQQARPIRVRFAPSPTGNLHIGGARTAIYNWAFAHRFGGSFILRIEDTDPERSTTQNTEQIIRALRWLGLTWDEGPGANGNDTVGDFGPYLQSQRFHLYREQLQKLIDNDKAYPCFCTPEELAKKRDAAQAAKNNYLYDRCCRDIPVKEAEKRIQSGEPHTWRLKVPLNHGAVSFTDLVYGEITIPAEQLDDFILCRSDGSPTYNFVVCVDDILMQISHIIRGDDHISNTPKQILVYEALQQPIPQFAHLSMILGGDGKRLSKRHGATSVEVYRDAGYLPEALLNYLSLLGWSLDGESTIISTAELRENFSLKRISKNPAVFDSQKLDWINQNYIKQMGETAFTQAILPRLFDAKLITQREAMERWDWLLQIYPLISERVKTLSEVPHIAGYLFSGDKVDLDEKSVEKQMTGEVAILVLKSAYTALSESDLRWDCEAIERSLRQLPEALNLKPKVVFQAIRVAVCGNMVSPPLFESLALIGRDNSLLRLKRAIDLASKGAAEGS